VKTAPKALSKRPPPGRNEKEGVFIEKIRVSVQVSISALELTRATLEPTQLEGSVVGMCGTCALAQQGCARAHSAIFSLLCNFSSKPPFLSLNDLQNAKLPKLSKKHQKITKLKA
jgi:hypothetical protein